LTPGVVAGGRGTSNAPIVGTKMRWGWVRCLACKPHPDDTKNGAKFKLVQRSAQEIAQRAEWATQKAEYKPQQAMSQLASVHAAAAASGAPAAYAPPAPDMSGPIAKLTEAVTNLTTQLGLIMAENAQLRAQLNGAATRAQGTQ
jgi:hypothetical protein